MKLLVPIILILVIFLVFFSFQKNCSEYLDQPMGEEKCKCGGGEVFSIHLSIPEGHETHFYCECKKGKGMEKNKIIGFGNFSDCK